MTIHDNPTELLLLSVYVQTYSAVCLLCFGIVQCTACVTLMILINDDAN